MNDTLIGSLLVYLAEGQCERLSEHFDISFSTNPNGRRNHAIRASYLSYRGSI
jgi:hypothetical protein